MRKLIQVTALLAVIVLGACEEAVAPPLSYEPPPEHIEQPAPEPAPEPEPTQPEPAGPLPVVSFATLTHSTTAGRTVILTINLSPPASQPISINFEGALKSGSVTAPAGASEAYISIPIPYDPTRPNPPNSFLSNLLIVPGDGYTVGQPLSHDLTVYQVPDYDPEPDPEYPDETHPLVNKIDNRCPYHIGMAPDGRGTVYPVMLLDRVSSVGTLCATGLASVSQVELDRISRASTAMLRNRQDLTGELNVVILMYSEGDEWCSVFPDPYANQFSECRPYGGPWFQPDGAFIFALIVCPDDNLSVCVHEIAHAVDSSLCCLLPVNQREIVIERFNEPDVADLWSGYGLTNHAEFFAELSSMYFCTPTGLTSPALTCADELQTYDPDSYDVIHAIYRGSADLR